MLVGGATSLFAPLLPFLRSYLQLTYTEMALFDSVFFIAYALFSYSFSIYINQYGIKKSLGAGLIIIFTGSLFWIIFLEYYVKFFCLLFATFIIAIGVVILFIVVEYIGLYLNGVKATRKLSYLQGAHGFGAFLAPLLVTCFLYKNNVIIINSVLPTIKVLFFIVCLIVVALYVATQRVVFPFICDFSESVENKMDISIISKLWIALFIYVGVEITIGSFIIPIGIGSLHFPLLVVKKFIYIYWLLIIVGRIIGGYIMRYINEMYLVCFNVLFCIISMLFVVNIESVFSLYLLSCLGLFNSILFPVLYSAAFSYIPSANIKVSGIMATAISGGAIIPFITGFLSDHFNLRASLFSIISCYIFIFILIIKLLFKSSYSRKESH